MFILDLRNVANFGDVLV